jgi:hypothetical protein
MHQSTNTSSCLVVSSDSSSASSEAPSQVNGVVTMRRKGGNKKTESAVENAIYAHIRAIRALGRKEVNTSEISDALSLPVLIVNRAIASLKKKGVKVRNG